MDHIGFEIKGLEAFCKKLAAQGVQFTAQAFTARLEAAGVAVSMDGKGRCLDNIFVERLWRTVKYEDIYIRGYETVAELLEGLIRYFAFYNQERLHQSLGYETPAKVYQGTDATRARRCASSTRPTCRRSRPRRASPRSSC